MAIGNARELYEEAWHDLFDLVVSRNLLLRRLDKMARVAMDVTPATGLVIEFDVSRAERLVAEIEELNQLISAGIQDVNLYAEQCGAPSVKWQDVSLGMR